MKLENLKIGKNIEISFDEAKELLKNTEAEYSFRLLNESSISETISFETVQNRSYSVVKVSRKGSILNKGSEYETRAEVGVFEVEMTYDYRHPSNFCLNKNNCLKVFRFSI